jgi:XapX domain-containing protein
LSTAVVRQADELVPEEHLMRSYLASLILGVAVGIVYGLVKVRSPAPPAIALLGLLGMLAGEQAVSFVRSHVLKSGIHSGRPLAPVTSGRPSSGLLALVIAVAVDFANGYPTTGQDREPTGDAYVKVIAPRHWSGTTSP